MYRTVILFITAVTVVTGKELVAVVHLTTHDAAKNITGDIKIVQSVPNGPVKLSGKVSGLTTGLHGFHVHEKGDLKEGCISTGAHFNPENNVHGAPEDTIRHVGDLGNIKANAEGEAIIDISDTVISLSGPNNILGRAIVIHSQEDDLGKGNHTLSNSTGNAGERWACGIIGVQSPSDRWSGSSSCTSSMLIIISSFTVFIFHQLKY